VNERGSPGGEDSELGLSRLPPGRHGLPRELVARNQRDRLAAGIITAVAEHGYHEATIAQIAAAAGVSRRTFYSYFSSKEECYFDTYGLIAEHLRNEMRGAGENCPDWPERVGAQLRALLVAFSANPDLVRFCLLVPRGAGGAIADRYREGLNNLLTILTDGAPQSSAAQPPSPAAEQALIGGMVALIVRKVSAGEGALLVDLLPDLLEVILTPYLGREAASRAAQRQRSTTG
jgi:AcrR family transcriptional regulator